MELINVVINDSSQTKTIDEEEHYLYINEPNVRTDVPNKSSNILPNFDIEDSEERMVQQTKVPQLELKNIIIYKMYLGISMKELSPYLKM